MDSIAGTLDGGILFGDVSESPPKRGRSTIPDATLRGWRDSLVWPLEHYWGQIGYELQQATTTAQIREVFSSLPEEVRTKFSFFVHSYLQASKTLEQRRLAKLYEEVSKQARSAREIEDKCRNSLCVVFAALQAAQGTIQQAPMEHEKEVRTRALAEAEQRRIDLEEQQRTLSDRMTDGATGFAQTELLRFVLDGRYELTPLNVANAIAGLPGRAWRQSFKRCIRWDCPYANSVEYRKFKIISAFLRSNVKGESLVERMRLYLQRKKLDKETREPVTELKRDWYYLRKATETIEGQNHPAEAGRFRIMAEYQRLYRSHTSVDSILAEEAQLW